MKSSRSYLVFGLVLAVTLEIGFQTWWNKQWGDYASPVVMFLAGVMTCFLALKLIGYKKESIAIAKENNKSKSIVKWDC